MSEDRTQAPSKRRWQLAREEGQAPHSPELTAAAALLGASAVLAARGEALGASLVAALRSPFLDGAALVAASNAEAVVARTREAAAGVGGPLLTILASAFLAATAAHQAQVRGLWAPGLLAPDVSRLWSVGRGPGAASRVGRGAWSIGKAAVVAVVAAWVIRSEWAAYQLLGVLEAPDLAVAAGRSLRRLGLVLGAATVVLGLADFVLTWFRFEAMLRTSPEEAREEMRSVEGDPALRARRMRISRARLNGGAGAAELAGASVVLAGASGLTVVLAGGPPPRFTTVRAIVSGAAGEQLRRDAAAAGLAEVDAPGLARRLARRRPPGQALTPELLDELGLVWARR